MIFAIIIGVLSLAGIVATIRTVSIDGYRRMPRATIARRPELVQR